MVKRSKKIVAGCVSVLAAVGIGAGALLWHPWDRGPDRAAADSVSDAVQPAEPMEQESEQSKVTIAGREIDYAPGEYGAVVVDGPAVEDFSSELAWEDYQANWHDKSWKGELPASGRYQYASYEDEEGFVWVAGEVLVVFNYDTPDERIEQVASGVGASVASVSFSEQVQDYKTAVFSFPDNGIDPLVVGQTIQNAAPEVVAALPNVVGKAEGTTNDPRLGDQGYLVLSRFKDAWDVVKCQGSVTVAVLDSGIDFYHSDLVDNIDVANAYDAIEREPLVRRDVDGHGTMVSGIIAAKANNKMDIAGCSYDARILPIRVLGDDGHFAVSDVGEALGHLFDLNDKPEVVNMSFGTAIDDWYDVIGELEYDLICQGRINELTENYGIVFVAAAGNEGATTNAKEYPAALDNVIGVGSVDGNRNHEPTSTANEAVDICAQGEKVRTTLTGGASGTGSGTSFAAPQVAAAAALLKAQSPSLTPAEVESKLESTAKDLGEPGRDDLFGFGLLDAAKAVGWKPSGGGSTSPSTGGSVYERYAAMLEETA